MMDSLNHLYFHKYRINLRPRELISLPPYKGSALRGVFGHALKRAACTIRDTECSDCILRLNCVYSVTMETPLPEDHPDHRRLKTAPHPYIINPPLTGKRTFTPDDPLCLDIVLIGKANDYLPYFIYTFTEMGRIGIGKERGKFELTSAEALHLDGTRTKIFDNADGLVGVPKNRIDYSSFLNREFEADEITLSFETPVRIKHHDRLSAAIPFGVFIERLSERAFLLAHLHCGAGLENFEEFAKDAKNVKTAENKLKWIDLERYSNRQNTRMKLGGLVGEITYKGGFHKYLPLLRLGEYIHVGKATTFGLGKYRIKNGRGSL